MYTFPAEPKEECWKLSTKEENLLKKTTKKLNNDIKSTADCHNVWM